MEIDNKTLSIVIPAYCSRATAMHFLESIAIQTFSHNLIELILVDDCSTESLEPVFRQFKSYFHDFKKALYVRNYENKGRSISRNVGLKEASGDVIFFIDVDNVLEVDTCGKIMLFFVDKPKAAARISIRVNPENLKTSAYVRFFDSRYLGARNNISDLLLPRYFATDGVAVTKSILKEIGGFDENFRHYGCEDEDLGIRIFNAGVPFYFIRDAKATDTDNPTLDRACKRMIDYSKYSMPILLNKHPDYAAMSLFSSLEQQASTSISNTIFRTACNVLPINLIAAGFKYLLNITDNYNFNPPAIFYKIVIGLYYIIGYKDRGQSAQE